MNWREVEAFPCQTSGGELLERLAVALLECGIDHKRLVSDGGASAVRLEARHLLETEPAGPLRRLLGAVELDELQADTPILLVSGEPAKSDRVGTVMLKTPAEDRRLYVCSAQPTAPPRASIGPMEHRFPEARDGLDRRAERHHKRSGRRPGG